MTAIFLMTITGLIMNSRKSLFTEMEIKGKISLYAKIPHNLETYAIDPMLNFLLAAASRAEAPDLWASGPTYSMASSGAMSS